MGENTVVNNQLTVVVPKNVKIGKDVTVMNGALMMAAGGITIEDKVLIAANVKLISKIMILMKEMFYYANQF